jgi:hypothetical protein
MPPSVSRLRLVPIFPRSVGFFPTFFPPEGGLGHGPIHRQPLPVDALESVVLGQTVLPQRQEHARCRPFLEAAMRGTTGTEARGIQGIPLTSGAQHKEDGIHRPPVVDSGAMAAQGVRFPPREQRVGTCP